MKWSRFALGMLPALPVAVVAVVLAFVGDSPPEEASEPAPTAEIAIEIPPTRSAPAARPRAPSPQRPRTVPPPPPEPAPTPSPTTTARGYSSNLGRCCAELRTYRRSTQPRFRATYDEVIDTCIALGEVAFEGDDEPMVAKIRAALQEKKAPFVPPSCR